MKNGFSLEEFLIVVAIVGILAGMFVMPFWACPARWSGSGLSAEFFVFRGCMVTRKDGTVIPEKAIRDVSL